MQSQDTTTEPTPAAQQAGGSCCAPEAKTTCCEPSAKADCCGAEKTGGGGCGCR